MARVAIIGAGVSGLSVGVSLNETHATRDLQLTIFAENFTNNGKDGMTSNAAGGLIKPGVEDATANDESTTNDRRWTTVTYDRFRQLRENGVGVDCGLNRYPILITHSTRRSSLPWYTSLLHPETKSLTLAEMEEHGVSPALFPTVWQYNISRVEPSRYLNYLTRRFRDHRGLMVRKKISNIKELTRDYDVIVNCTGLGARELIGDLSLHPVRGQIVEVEGPNLKVAYHTGTTQDETLPTYIIPSYNGKILLGGTAHKDNWSTAINPEHTTSIYKRCLEMCSKLQGARIVGGWAGLRPQRPSVRVEVDEEFAGEPLLIHNYGHSSYGFIYSWGCASDVVGFVTDYRDLDSPYTPKL